MRAAIAAGAAGGAVFAAATRVLTSARGARKPLHPHGEVLTGRIYRHGSTTSSGVPWLDLPGQDPAVVRRSRALGLPESLPDIHGLAVRLVPDQGGGDLLFASTGWGRVGRFVLTASRGPRTRPLTTLLTYRGNSGPIHLGARAISPSGYELSGAGHDGVWHTFAELLLSGRPGKDQDISFDPIRRPVAGLQQYSFLVGLQVPAYRTARRSRGQHRAVTPPRPPKTVQLVQPKSHG